MSSDRFVYWKTKKPTPQQVREIIEDFLGEALKNLTISDDAQVFDIGLFGHPSHPLRRQPDVPDVIRKNEIYPQPERWIEIIMHNHCLDVITRQGDEYTSAIADGLAAVFIRYFQARKGIR